MTLNQLPMVEEWLTVAYRIWSMRRTFLTGTHEYSTGETDPSQ